jgi:hypothetical protein
MLPIEFDKVTIVAAPQTPSAFSDLVSVLVMIGLPAGPANPALSRHAIDPSPGGVAVNVFNDLARLPRHRDAFGIRRKAGRCRRLAFGRC